MYFVSHFKKMLTQWDWACPCICIAFNVCISLSVTICERFVFVKEVTVCQNLNQSSLFSLNACVHSVYFLRRCLHRDQLTFLCDRAFDNQQKVDCC